MGRRRTFVQNARGDVGECSVVEVGSPPPVEDLQPEVVEEVQVMLLPMSLSSARETVAQNAGTVRSSPSYDRVMPPPIAAPPARTTWIRHVAAPSTLQRVVSALESEGIPVLPVKGILTAHVLYEDIAARPIGDIDLRLPRGRFRTAVRVGRAHGWAPQTVSPRLWEAMLKVDGWEVDIECTLGPPGLCALSVEDVLERAQRSVEPFGFPHLQPELNDHALILVLNAFKDGLRPMPWALEDLRRIARHAQFDPQALVSRARQGRVVSALWVIATWLADEHGAPEWRDVRARIGPSPPSVRVDRVYAWVRRRGWPPKPGLLVTAGASDGLRGCASGLALAAAGITRARFLRTLQKLRT